MAKNDITREEWRNRTRDSLKWTVSILLGKTETTGIHIEILKDIPEGDIKVSEFNSWTYKREQQYQFFYFGSTGAVAEFGVYQKRMSLRSHGKSICLNGNQPMETLCHEEAGCYNEAIVNFVMANIVWE